MCDGSDVSRAEPQGMIRSAARVLPDALATTLPASHAKLTSKP
jgi:hypothetical protein